MGQMKSKLSEIQINLLFLGKNYFCFSSVPSVPDHFNTITTLKDISKNYIGFSAPQKIPEFKVKYKI